MTHRILPLLSAVALFVPLAGCVARAGGGITNVIPVQLQEGANLVPHLAPDGRQGLVVEGRQPDALAPLIMTMLPRAEGQRGWDVVEIEAADGSRLPTLDARGRAVLFARAKVGGIPATLLFVAVPDPGDAVPPRGAAPHADPDAAPAGRRDQRPLRADPQRDHARPLLQQHRRAGRDLSPGAARGRLEHRPLQSRRLTHLANRAGTPLCSACNHSKGGDPVSHCLTTAPRGATWMTPLSIEKAV